MYFPLPNLETFLPKLCLQLGYFILQSYRLRDVA